MIGWQLLLGSATAAPTNLKVTVRNGTGDIRLTNTGASTQSLTAYSITYPTAELRSAEWLPISGRLDASGDLSVDANDDWLIFGQQPLPSLVNILGEGEFNGDGGFLQPGDSIYLGAVWNPFTSPSLNFEVVESVGGNHVASFLDITYLAAGDFNENGIVDIADYNLWRDSVGQTGVGLLADGDGSGVVDVGDYNLWQFNFGLTSFVIPAPGGASLAVSMAIPEPRSITIFLALAGMIGVARCAAC